MAAIIFHPQNALQAKAFTAQSSLSYGTGEVTPTCLDAEGQEIQQQLQQLQSSEVQGPHGDNGPATAADTSGGGPGVSKIIPTLQ
jgi:transcription initiation factor TFIID TATA-box-binding protein